jgi:hypothetical protein
MKKSVFFLAHYDDEFGIFEDIRIHIAQKIPLHIVYVTSSSLNGVSNKIRENESLFVLKKLGVKRNQISFIGKELSIPDLALKDHLMIAFVRCKSLVEKLRDVTTIYSHAYEGGHPDHDVLNFLCSKIILTSKTRIDGVQFPLYCGPGLIGPLFYLFKPLKNNGKIKKKSIKAVNIRLFIKLILVYKSQFKTFFWLFPFYLIHMIFKRNAITQKINPNKAYNRPHKGKLLYERRKMNKFEHLKLKMGEFESWLKKKSKSYKPKKF